MAFAQPEWRISLPLPRNPSRIVPLEASEREIHWFPHLSGLKTNLQKNINFRLRTYAGAEIVPQRKLGTGLPVPERHQKLSYHAPQRWCLSNIYERVKGCQGVIGLPDLNHCARRGCRTRDIISCWLHLGRGSVSRPMAPVTPDSCKLK